jgi:hypothetical protein
MVFPAGAFIVTDLFSVMHPQGALVKNTNSAAGDKCPANGIADALFLLIMKALPIRILVYTLWLVTVGTGIVMILDYENASGSVGTAPEYLLSGTQIPLDHNRDTLIMFAHPRCPAHGPAWGN